VKVNLYTDAGVRNGVATWGAVCAPKGRERVERCGRMREDLKDTTAAELRAMADGLHSMLRAGVIQRGDEVKLFCDNQDAVAKLNGATPMKREKQARHRDAVGKVLDMAALAGVKVKGAHVKGHQKLTSTCPHAPFNRRADELCTLARQGEPPKPRRIVTAAPAVSRARRALEMARKLEGRG